MNRATIKFISRIIYVFFPMWCGFMYGITRNILYVVGGTLPLLVYIYKEEDEYSIKIVRFRENDGKKKQGTKKRVRT